MTTPARGSLKPWLIGAILVGGFLLYRSQLKAAIEGR